MKPIDAFRKVARDTYPEGTWRTCFTRIVGVHLIRAADYFGAAAVKTPKPRRVLSSDMALEWAAKWNTAHPQGPHVILKQETPESPELSATVIE